jgi:hypothetical protein
MIRRRREEPCQQGVSRAADAGDVTVAYLIIVANNVTTTSINTYFGYGRVTEGHGQSS